MVELTASIRYSISHVHLDVFIARLSWHKKRVSALLNPRIEAAMKILSFSKESPQQAQLRSEFSFSKRKTELWPFHCFSNVVGIHNIEDCQFKNFCCIIIWNKKHCTVINGLFWISLAYPPMWKYISNFRLFFSLQLSNHAYLNGSISDSCSRSV